MKLFRPLLIQKLHQNGRFDNNPDARNISQRNSVPGVGCCSEIFLPPVYSKKLDDKIALVNGGSYGVGLKCARELLKSGVKGLMISGSNEDQGKEIIKELCRQYEKDKLAFIRGDPTKESILNHVFSETQKHFGGLDIVVNHLQHIRDLKWESQIDLNVTGLVRLTKEGIKHMSIKNQGHGGIIINAISMGDNMKYENCPLFLGIKHFIIAFTRALSANSYDTTCVKIITLCFDECQITSEELASSFQGISDAGYDLRTIVCKAKNGSVWTG